MLTFVSRCVEGQVNSQAEDGRQADGAAALAAFFSTYVKKQGITKRILPFNINRAVRSLPYIIDYCTHILYSHPKTPQTLIRPTADTCHG